MEFTYSGLVAEKEQSLIRNKRILFFLNNFQIGGAHLQMTHLIKALKEDHFEPIICTHLNTEGGLKEAYYNLDVKIYSLSRKSAFDLSILKKLKKILVDEQIEMIVLFMPHSFVYYHLVKPFLKRKVYQVGLLRAMGFWLGHRNSVYRFIDNFLCARLIKTSDLVIANSVAIKRQYDKMLALPDNKIKVVYNASEFNFKFSSSREEIRRQLDLREKDIVVIMVARLDPWKDFDTFLKAAKEVAKKERIIKFWICGGGILEQTIREKIVKYSLEDVVEILGEKSNVPDFINASDISVLTTKGEGFSNVIMESMALSKPVVATNVGGNSEVIGRDSRCGFLVESKDYNSLAEILLKLAKDEKLRREVGANAYERIHEMCEKKRNLNSIINYLHSLQGEN